MNQHRVAFVTGASAGIGKAIVRRLLKEGWTVYGAARRMEKMNDIQSEGAAVVSLDVTDDDSMQQAVQTVLVAEGRIDALVNNAGYGSYGAIEDVPLDEARRQFEVNVFGFSPMVKLLSHYDYASSPDYVAAAVAKAVNYPGPRRRYATPMDAKLLIFLHWLLPTAVWERLLKLILR